MNHSQVGEASPNPDFPQDVNNVTGSNEIKIQNKNIIANETFVQGGVNGNTDTTRISCRNVKFEPNTAYTLSSTLDYSNYYINIVVDTTTFPHSAPFSYDSGWKNTNVSFSTGANDVYGNIAIRKANNSAITPSDIAGAKFQIEKGNTATSYIAHREEDYYIDLPVENLFDYTKSTVVQNATVETINNIVKLTATSTVTGQNIFYRTKIDDSLLVSGQSYTLSYEGVQNVNSPLKLQLRNHDGSYATGQSQADTVTYDSNYSLFVAGNPFGTTSSISSGTVCIFKNVQVVKGTKTQAYTPYGTTPIELCKIGTYQDYIYEKNGKWYKYGKIAKKKVVGSDIDKLQNSSGGIYQYRTLTGYLTNIITSANQWNLNLALCNYFKKYTNLNNLDALGFNTGSNGQLDINSNITTLADFRTWVDSVDLVVYYVQETPTITEITYEPLLTQLDKLDKIGLYDISNISQDNSDMKMLLDFTICNDNYNGLREFIRA